MTNVPGQSWNMQDLKRLADCLGKLPPVDVRRETAFSTSAERLLDCVLSLHRRYDEFAAHRVRDFKKNHPNVSTIADLRECVRQCGGPIPFYKTELDYWYPDAAEMFGRVLDYIEKETRNHPGANDLERLNRWACAATVVEYNRTWSDGSVKTNIPLFGIAGWQYMRMLFGADTCKPDVAVNGFVKDCLGRKYLSPIATVQIVETAAPTVPELNSNGRPVREADRRIWHKYNETEKRKRSARHGCR